MLSALQELENKAKEAVEKDISDKISYYKTTNDLLRRKVAETVTLADDIRREIDGYKEKLYNLQSILSTLQDKYAAEKSTIPEEVKKLEMKQFDLSLQKKLCAELQEQLDQFQFEPKLCDKELKLLAECRKKLNLYYQTTRIRWNYSAPENVVKGYVTNKCKTEAEPFSFSTDEGLLREKLWDVVEQVVDTDWKDLEEGAVSNKEE